jgi:methionine sulfoxide reductase heme-binding subunit
VSAGYRAVGWNRSKRVYDTVLLGATLLALGAFTAFLLARHPEVTLETAILRATGACALLLLHLVLAIGPLCRLDRRFLPLLYNRRHLGVTMFAVAALHGGFALVQYHALGDANPLVSLLTGGGDWSSPREWPFQPFGAAALAILFLMAATSHDVWLANLTAPVWKALHMLVYAAWLLVLAHVTLGVLQDERGAPLAIALGAGTALLCGLHLVAAARERRVDAATLRPAPAPAPSGSRPAGFTAPSPADGLLDVCAVDELREGRGRVVSAGGERVALFRSAGRIAALSSVCQHQNGPLGEGRVQDGCIVCPWHGYQYAPESGRSPPPFTEAVPTFRVVLRDGRVLLDPHPCAPGTVQALPVIAAAPAPLVERDPVQRDPVQRDPVQRDEEFYVGYLPAAPPRLRRFVRGVVACACVVLFGAGALLLSGQGPFRASRFEYGHPAPWRGVLREGSAPALEVRRPGIAAAGLDAPPDLVSRYLLVAPGKHGAQELCAGLDGQTVALEGTLIHRDGVVMLELTGRPVPAGAGAGAARVAPDAPVALGEVELVGQVVDSKCYFGVMNPADTVTHRACAERCLSGGVPALLRVRAADGTELTPLLTGRDGRSLNLELLDRVAVPVRVRGALERQGDLLLLRTSPEDVVRLDGR